MPFEDFDNKIRQAAEQHHPNYDEKAWSRMETLLDKHLPQKEDRRRRIIFFLLTLLLLGGGAWLLIDKPWQQNALVQSQKSSVAAKAGTDSSPVTEDVTVNDKEPVATSPGDHQSEASPVNTDPEGVTVNPAGNDIAPGSSKKKNETGISAADPAITPATVGINQQEKNPNQTRVPIRKKNTGSNNDLQIDVVSGNIGKGKQTTGAAKQTDKDKQEPSSSSTALVTTTRSKNNEPGTAVIDNKKDQPVLPVSNDVSVQNKTTVPVKDSTVVAAKTEEKKAVAKKEHNKKTNTFFFSLSAGPDVSSVRLSDPGKVRLLTGAGLGYTFRDRLTVRTGFYSASKIYQAKPSDYKPKIPVQNAAYLKDIEANCKVYEIPLSLSYNFGKSTKHKTFASIGLSSFIMKKETYDYWYEYPGVPPTNYYTHTVNNENKHYFSVLSLSAGYQRKVNRLLSVSAEPYFKLPLAGVGYGKVKLNSFGVLFSVNISPFSTK